jgi:hypothetical protein
VHEVLIHLGARERLTGWPYGGTHWSAVAAAPTYFTCVGAA